jgi:D-proline reductase (dithiol) PrdB
MVARVITRFPALAKRFIDSYRPWESDGEIPWATPAKPLSQSTLALVTTSGIHHVDQAMFDMSDEEGDPSYREIDGEKIFSEYKITHDYYDHADAEKDLNIIFPLERLNELEKEGKVGKIARTHYSFMGHIDGPHIATLIQKTAKEVAEKLKNDQVDLVLLTPA